MRRGKRSDAGSATVLALGVVLAGCLVAALWLAGARAALARQRAETAADLAALAAAQSAVGNGGIGVSGVSGGSAPAAEPCQAAATIAQRNGARLGSCAVTDEVASVRVIVDDPTTASAQARAGPQVRP
jgi:secretion/DNA translocation related TadE-like protein